MKLIGIAGPAGAGKSTVARILAEKHGWVEVALADSLKRMAKEAFGFSDQQLWGESEFRDEPDKRFPRKHTWREADGIEEFQAFGGHEFKCVCCGATDERLCYLTPRFCLQLLGTEWGRYCYEDVWIDKVIAISKALLGRWRPSFGVFFGSYAYASYTPKLGLHRLTRVDRETAGVTISDVRFENEASAIRAAGGVIWHKEGSSSRSSTHASEAGIAFSVDDDVVPYFQEAEVLERHVGALVLGLRG